jgi:hypothetical protein
VAEVRDAEVTIVGGGAIGHGVSGSAGLAGHVLESLQPDPSPYVKSLGPGRYLPPQLPRAGDDRRRSLSDS